MIARLAIAGLCLAAVPGSLQSQDGTRVTFETIIKSLDAHKKMYGTNKRIVGATKSFTIESNSGQYVASLVDELSTNNRVSHVDPGVVGAVNVMLAPVRPVAGAVRVLLRYFQSM